MIPTLIRIKYKLIRFFKNKGPIFYTKDFFRNTKYIVGDYSYGCPHVIFQNKDANLHIGKFCSIGEGVTIFLGGNHRTDWITTYPFNEVKDFHEAKDIIGHPTTKGDVTIQNDVWIGRNATILSGITIGNGAAIAAESVVVKNVGAYEIWGGNPAKFIKKRFDDEKIQSLEKSKWWNWDKEKIMSNVHVLCSSNINDFLNL